MSAAKLRKIPTVPRAALSSATERSAWRRGVAIAIKLLEDAEVSELSECTIDDSYRNGAPQKNFVLSHLRQLRELNDSIADRAFASVLSSYLSLNVNVGTPILDVLEREARQPIATAEVSHG
jgi:hypothetical protein